MLGPMCSLSKARDSSYQCLPTLIVSHPGMTVLFFTCQGNFKNAGDCGGQPLVLFIYSPCSGLQLWGPVHIHAHCHVHVPIHVPIGVLHADA